jgi:hypothetical protein
MSIPGIVDGDQKFRHARPSGERARRRATRGFARHSACRLHVLRAPAAQLAWLFRVPAITGLGEDGEAHSHQP